MKHPSRCLTSSTGGVALVMTLAVLTMISISLVAFLSSVTIDMKASRAYWERERAEQAMEAGLAHAFASLKAATAERRTFVTAEFPEIDDPDGHLSPVVLISKNDEDVRLQPIPLISHSIPLDDFSAVTSATDPLDAWKDLDGTLVAPGFRALRNARRELTTSIDLNGPNYRLLHPSNISGLPVTDYYRAPAIDIIDSETGLRTARFAYVIMDEQAKFSPRQHRGEVPVADDSFENAPARIQPYFDAVRAPIHPDEELSSKEQEELAFLKEGIKDLAFLPTSFGIAARLFEPEELGTARWRKLKHLITGAQVWNEATIPAGYPSAGKPKWNINELANAVQHGATPKARAENIAKLIDQELPDFKNRDPSLTGSDSIRYLNRLAASIVDYIDTDSNITQVNGTEPAGRDLFPLVTTIAEGVKWISEKESEGSYIATLESKVYVQVYNPYTTTIKAGATVEILVANRMRVEYGTGIVEPLADYRQAVTLNRDVRPNEFIVIEFPDTTDTFTTPDTVDPKDRKPSWGGSPTNTADQTSHVKFEFSYAGQVVDMHSRSPRIAPGARFAGMTRNAKTLTLNAPHYQVSFVPTFADATTPNLTRFVGDPRGTYLTSYDWGGTLSGNSSYSSKARWNGRQMDTHPRSMNYETWWAQRDYVRANARQGQPVGSINKTPAEASSSYSADDANDAIAYLRNGPMQSTGELGNVYDPAQVNDKSSAPTGGSPKSPYTSGGGRTLRIGYPELRDPEEGEPNYGSSEFKDLTGELFSTEGKRAPQLLDLFTVDEIDSIRPTGYPQSFGRININTAPSEVLQELVRGIGPSLDKGVARTGISEAGALNFADAVIALRPFNRISDLTSATEALVTRVNFDPPPQAARPPQTEYIHAMDYGREQMFTQIVEALTVQSRAFRILVVGQVFDQNGQVRGEAAGEALVILEPPEASEATPTDSMEVKSVAFRMLD